ncbi:excalibur calcium-binding domain-containing protein [Micromonospora sp. KC213]|uniref:excalibur calcium-binding domain-containing protein n=1 Tax=Micromonospora sp. KC213 TaxID=2530378 RepID=UPI0010527813|nr:excalibur calcium-binding domain-containing protein [Micromonospora sp. KC213]TDC42094.1 hypothetical protein E1166_09050 [Micromonospora sp. KC213]
MSKLRWNFRLGPLQFNSPVGVIGGSVLAGIVLCCCGAGIVGAINDDTSPTAKTQPLTTSAPAAAAPARTTATAPAPAATTPRPAVAATTKPTAKPAATTRKPAPKPTTRKPTPAAPKTDPRFDTCREANREGYGPYEEGKDPEYEWYQDRDGDGIVCERG